MAYSSLRIMGTGPWSYRNWIDANSKRSWQFNPELPSTKVHKYQSEVIEKLSRKTQPVRSEDKLEQRGSISDYQPVRGTFKTGTDEAVQEAKEEYLRDRRELAKWSIVFRTYYKGGIGLNFDVLA